MLSFCRRNDFSQRLINFPVIQATILRKVPTLPTMSISDKFFSTVDRAWMSPYQTVATVIRVKYMESNNEIFSVNMNPKPRKQIFFRIANTATIVPLNLIWFNILILCELYFFLRNQDYCVNALLFTESLHLCNHAKLARSNINRPLNFIL